MSELRECPFCGGEAAPMYPGARSFEVCCMVCNAETGVYDSVDEAANAWNKRAERTCKDTGEYPRLFTCSACGVTQYERIDPNYCPNCGARVIGD